MAHAERLKEDDQWGHVPNPAVVKELHLTDFREAVELLEAATKLGFGVQLSNYVGPDADEEWWSLFIYEDLPLRKDDEEGDGA